MYKLNDIHNSDVGNKGNFEKNGYFRGGQS